MVAIGFGLTLLGYWLGLSGFSLVKGYDNRPIDLINPFFHGTWSTTLYTGPSVFPGAAAPTSQASALGGNTPGGMPGQGGPGSPGSTGGHLNPQPGPTG